MRRVHETVAAAIIAAPRERPLDLAHEVVRVAAEVLPRLEGAGLGREGEDALAVEQVELNFPTAEEDGVAGAEAPVAEAQGF